MPHEAIESLRDMIKDQATFMIPADDAQVAANTMILVLRQQAQILDRMATRQDTFEAGMKDISEVVHSTDKKLAVIGENALRDIQRNHDRLDRHSRRLDVLERDCVDPADLEKVRLAVDLLTRAEAKREGAVGFMAAIKDYGPVLIVIIGVIVFLVLQGKI